MKMLAKDAKDAKKSPPKVEVPLHVNKSAVNKKKEVEENNFKLNKFKNVESKIKAQLSK
jgi:hypothetical protein